MKTSLVIMAAGMGSRFSKNELKQLTPVGPNQEIIMDYSIYDAKRAGFDEVVFIIRKDIEQAFEEAIGKRIKKVIDVKYVYQELDRLPEGLEVIQGREKPLGTGHAILMCKDIVHNPFVVINADDYYGRVAFENMHQYLTSHPSEKDYCMSGFILKNTLSDHGSVSRGICKVDNGYLVHVVEHKNIYKTKTGASSNDQELDINSLVSMNMWGLKPTFLDLLEEGFYHFFRNMKDPLKDEYLLPEVIDRSIQSKKSQVAMLETTDQWFGVTYKEDKEYVQNCFSQLVQDGVYPTPLF